MQKNLLDSNYSFNTETEQNTYEVKQDINIFEDMRKRSISAGNTASIYLNDDFTNKLKIYSDETGENNLTNSSTPTKTKNFGNMVRGSDTNFFDLHSNDFGNRKPQEVKDGININSPLENSKRKRNRRPGLHTQRQKRELKRTVFLEPLPENSTEESVREILRNNGVNVQDLFFYDENKTSCYVRLENKTEAEKLLKLAKINGAINVSLKSEHLQYVKKIEKQIASLDERRTELTKMLVKSPTNLSMIPDFSSIPSLDLNLNAPIHNNGSSRGVRKLSSSGNTNTNTKNNHSNKKPAQNNGKKKFDKTSNKGNNKKKSKALKTASPLLQANKSFKSKNLLNTVAKGPDGTKGFNWEYNTESND